MPNQFFNIEYHDVHIMSQQVTNGKLAKVLNELNQLFVLRLPKQSTTVLYF